ncbi:pigment epithelium-derived factor [Sardina pilchardus]|uniref:pigment epithelium-derived factor n=1 Tax=Sardina pilchardus TaxID=27697 RepID=UPI002E0EA134
MARPLFGGALSATIPPSAQDISELREIPDNQEVFAHRETDQSIIVELLDYQSHVENEDAAKYHFEDVAGSNKASEPGTCEVRSVQAIPKAELSLQQCASAWLLTGGQLVSKFNEEAKNTVNTQASQDSATNIFMSPLSVSLALTQLSMGASDQAEKQLYRALRYHTLQDPKLHATLSGLLVSLKAPGKGFTSAARVLLPRRLRLKPGYLNDVEKQYGVKPSTLTGGPRDMKTINDWVKKETGGKINPILSSPLPRNGGISSVGAAYFKGKWLTRFSQTSLKENFHLDGQEPVRVSMMHETNYPLKMGKDSDIGCMIAQVQMEEGVSMFIFLPDEVTQNLTQIVEVLTAEFVQDLSMTLHPAKAELTLPVLKLSYATDFLPLLPDLGLSEWLANTDLIKITAQPAKISGVFHKVAMEMAPEGSQRATATDQPLHMTYRVDRPFVFLIRDEPTGTLLFIGKVLNPQG